MTKLSDMITEMEDEMDRSDPTAFTSKINAAIRHYQPTRFWFNETRSVTFSTVIGQQDYSFDDDVPAFFYEIDGIFVTFGSSIIDCKQVDFREIENLRGSSQTNNVPTRWAYDDEKLIFYPPPDQVYSVRVAGHQRIDPPADSNVDDNKWMNEGYDLIKSEAKARLFAQKYRDTEGAAIERVVATDAESDLSRATASKTGTGSVRPTRF